MLQTRLRYVSSHEHTLTSLCRCCVPWQVGLLVACFKFAILVWVVRFVCLCNGAGVFLFLASGFGVSWRFLVSGFGVSCQFLVSGVAS